MRWRNVEKFTTEMQQLNWNCVTDISGAQASYSEFHRVISQKYNKCFPYRKMNKPYHNNKPWLTNAMKESIKMKNKLYIIRNKGNMSDESNERYRMYRNKLNHILRSAERKYYQDLLIEHKANVKKSWQIIKGIINKRKYRINNTKFKHNGDIIEDGKLVADKFNKYFVNVGETLAKSISPSKRKPEEYINFKPSEYFYLTEVSENEINTIIGNFNNSSPGWDELKPGLIKMIKNYVKTPLTHICNRSFETGIFPSELKIANVVPIFKSSDEMIFSNYRPVSVLPVFSKVLERLMYNRLITYINQNHLLYNLQFGFQKGKSTHMALITLIDKISEALDDGDFVIGVFLDFSKAFDTVDHNILLKKLDIYGIRGLALKWFGSYLSNRMQYVTYNSIKSEREVIKCGVPQGSILGPLLSLIYINDLATVSRNCLPILFADDTNIFLTGKNLSELTEFLNEDLVNIEEWLRCNRLSLNVLKTNYMIFTTKNKLGHDVDIFVNNVRIERVYVTKFLGVQIDSKLNWKNHIEYTCKKLSKCVGIIAKARRKLHKSHILFIVIMCGEIHIKLI